ncbi:MAG: DUF3047 domain-containing protein [Gemmatimonadetes bacterium]|nr:DUF3047 domain-containing protein [Gemmatimonadota bacterium]
MRERVATMVVGAGLALAGFGSAPAAAARLEAASDRVLGRLEEARIGAALPPGWQLRPVRGVAAPTSQVVADARHGRAIRFDARKQAGFFGIELAEPLDAAGGRLAWQWRVEEPVPGAALRDPARDDSAARFFVIFGRRGLLTPPRMIFYSWGNQEAHGAAWPSRVSGRMHIVVLRNAADGTGRWLAEERDLAADYRDAFGGEPPAVTGIGFMIDTDDTGARAVGMLGPVLWRPGR